MIVCRAQKLLAYAAAAQAKAVPSEQTTGEAERRHHDMLRRRAGHAARNSGFWANGIRVRRRALMTNPRPQCTEDALQEAWDSWAQGNVGYRHNHGSFAALLIKIANAVAEYGGLWIQKIQTAADLNGLRFQLWPDHLRERTIENGREDGIAYDDNGDIESVLFRSQSSSAAESHETRRAIPGRDLFWVRYALDPGQIGGVSPGVPGLEPDEMLRQYSVNALTSAQTRAALTFVVEQDGPNMRGTNTLVHGRLFTDAQGRTLRSVAPGTVAYAWNGAKVTTPKLDAQPDLSRHFERQIAAGTGFARELMAGEVGDANFSALRMARNAATEDGEECRHVTGWHSMLRWMTLAFIEAERIEGRTAWRLEQFKWLAQPPLPIDRYKEVLADSEELENHLVSRTELIRRRGRNPEDVAEELKRDRELGLVGAERETTVPTESTERKRHGLSLVV